MRILNKFISLTAFTLAFATIFTMSSCSDDDEPSFIPTLPAKGGNNVKSIYRTGGITKTAYDWNFSFSGPRLTKATGVIRDPDTNVDGSHKYTSNITYGNRRVSLHNTGNEKVEITLNGSNYIEQMKVNNNIYHFQYNNGHLCAWQKTIFENSFGQADKYLSSAIITYENDDLKRIDFIGPDNVKVTTTFVPDVRNNLNGLLPETIAKEFGCLGFEHLYYAGLLGRPTAHLVKSLTVSHPKDESQCYTLNFEYSVRGNNTELCNYNTPSGEPVSTNYSY